MRPIIVPALALALLILLLSGVPQIGNGGFESPPPSPGAISGWSQVSAVDAVQRDASGGVDGGMPVQGQRWLTFSGQGSSAATAPTNPGGFGNPPSNVVWVAESFQLSGSNTTLELDVVFLCNEQLLSAYRDFLSVDLGDGTSWLNLRYLDNHASFPTTSVLYQQTLTGSPMPSTGIKHVSVDIPSKFPNATSQTVFTLRLAIGNGIDGSLPSRGYFDDVKFTPGTPIPQASGPAQVTITPWGTNGDWLLDCQAGAWPYGEIYNIFSANVSLPPGAGPFGGIVPDFATYFSIWQPQGTHPFHVTLDGQGRYRFVIPSWVSPGVTGDLFMAVLWAGQVVAVSPPIRHTF